MLRSTNRTLLFSAISWLSVLAAPSAQLQTEEAKLVAGIPQNSAWFGQSVAISGDTAVVGAHLWDDVGALNQGSAYVFVRNGTSWSEQAHLVASGGAARDEFGHSVAISGETVVVGAPRWDDVGVLNQGSAYVFVRNGTSWSEQAHLVPSGGTAGDEFGWSAAISGDTAVIGAIGDDVEQGSAYVFVRNGTSWSEQAHLVASGGAAADVFGWSAAISGDTAVIGAFGDDAEQGSAYVFVRNGTSWSEQAHLVASGGAAGDEFGFSVAISGDTVVVGAQEDSYPVAGPGSAYVFVRNGTIWSQQAYLASPGTRFFGKSVAISGETIVAGSLFGGYVFVRNGTSWTEQVHLVSSDCFPNELPGRSAAISGDTVVLGAPTHTTEQGAVYVFRPGVPSPCGNPLFHASSVARIGSTWTATVTNFIGGGTVAHIFVNAGPSICVPITLGGRLQYVVTPIPPYGTKLFTMGPVSYNTGMPQTATFMGAIPNSRSLLGLEFVSQGVGLGAGPKLSNGRSHRITR